jgi:hypothetical protein
MIIDTFSTNLLSLENCKFHDVPFAIRASPTFIARDIVRLSILFLVNSCISWP